MAYARHGEDSDVYVFSDGEMLHCMDCSESAGLTFRTPSRQLMLEHLVQHIADGDLVPGHALERLANEIQGEGDRVGGDR